MSNGLKNNLSKLFAIVGFLSVVHFMFLPTEFNFFSIFIRPSFFQDIFIPGALLLSGLTYCYGARWFKAFRSDDSKLRSNISNTAGKLAASIVLISISAGFIGAFNHYWTDKGAVGPLFGGGLTQSVVVILLYVVFFLPLNSKINIDDSRL